MEKYKLLERKNDCVCPYSGIKIVVRSLIILFIISVLYLTF